MNNGRVELDATPPPPFAIFSSDHPESGSPSVYGEPTLKSKRPTPVSALFFSDTNVNAVQDAIRYRVWVDTAGKHVIGRQNDIELMTVMRSIYLQYSINAPTDITGQVRILNAHVLNFCVPRIVSEVEMYMRYRKDISQLPVPLERAPMATSKGSRSLPGNPHLFGKG